MNREKERELSNYLTCERNWVFELLMLSAGMMGSYTYVLRGGVFCNAQTANFVVMSVFLGQGNWKKALYYLIPMSAYCAGALLSEALPNPVKKKGFLRWDTYLIGFEIFVLFLVGWIPLSGPDHLVQVLINFIASMQYNTFRQAEGVPMATTFCTNHLRQLGIGIADYLRKKDITALKKGLKHLKMIGFFFCGGILSTVFCGIFQEKAIWAALVPMVIVFGMLVLADLGSEREKLREKPHGH